MDNRYDKMQKEEFDVDTGTYMEDVHANDFVGLDVDGNGLVDNVEKLIEDAEERAQKYNEEQDRVRETLERDARANEEPEEEKTAFSLTGGM